MSAAIAEVVAVRVPERSWRSEVRAVRIVWRRDLIRFATDRMRIAALLIQPLLFLFVLGSGLQPLSAASTDGVDLTYAVDPMRRLVFNHLDISEAARRTLDPGVTWFGWRVPSLVEVGIVLALGLAMLAVAIFRFTRTE
jgi:ABC-2 type transport system permease protein